MKITTILRVTGYAFIAAGLLLVVGIRVWGVDMTEGQVFVKALPLWILSIGLILGGAAIVSNASKPK